MSQRDNLWAYAFISPWLIGFLVFTLGPMVASLYFSFTRYNIIDPAVSRGLDNYQRLLFEDPLFWHSLQRTLYFAALALPLGLTFGFFLAILLNQEIPAVNLWRTVYFLPSVVAGVAVALLWMRLFNPRIGLVNPFLENVFGIENPPGWLQDPQWAIPSLVIMSLWGVGGSIIIYLAGLQGIPTDALRGGQDRRGQCLAAFPYVTIAADDAGDLLQPGASG